MSRPKLWWAFAAALVTTVAGAAQTFTVLFVNDFHSCLESFIIPGQNEETGGIDRLAGLIRELRAANEKEGIPTFLLVGGDIVQGPKCPLSMYGAAYRGKASFDCLNEMGVDAAALGNHEFQYGWDNLHLLIAAAAFPITTANVKYREGPRRGETVVPEAVWLRVGAKRILVFGLTVPMETRDNPDLVFEDPVETARGVVERYDGQADAVIALNHIGSDGDIALAQAVPRIGIIIGGHTHEGLERVKKVGTTALVRSEPYGTTLGRIDLLFKDNGELVIKNYELIPIRASTPTDEAVAAVVENYREGLTAEFGPAMGEKIVTMNSSDGRVIASNFGEFVADALREATGADAALVNNGVVGVGLNPGPITVAEAMAALPIASTKVVVVPYKGAALKKALEHCARFDVGAAGFLQVSNITCVFTPPAGVSGIKINEKPLDETASYKVALPGFLTGKVYGYKMLAARHTFDTGLTVGNVIIKSLSEGRRIPSRPESRITVAEP